LLLLPQLLLLLQALPQPLQVGATSRWRRLHVCCCCSNAMLATVVEAAAAAARALAQHLCNLPLLLLRGMLLLRLIILVL
jgi:hypothetical protein